MAIKLESVTKTYDNGVIQTKALISVNLTIEEGEFVVVLGPSGSGKSTLLNIMGGLDHPSEGHVTIQEKRLDLMDEKQLTEFRRKHMGFIFQQYNLLQTLTGTENVELGAYISKNPMDVNVLIDQVGLSAIKDKYPHQMSGGEQQRISIARALVKRPSVLLCDEPTGALDETNGKEILKLLQDLNTRYQTTIILITHNPAITQIADRVIKMNSGRVIENVINLEKTDASVLSWS